MKKDDVLEKLNQVESLLKKQDEQAYKQASKPLNFKEACAYLGYASSYLYKLTSTGKIPHYKPSGKMLFFSKAELDDWVFGRYGVSVKGETGDGKGECGGVRSGRKEIRSKKSERERGRQKSEIRDNGGKK